MGTELLSDKVKSRVDDPPLLKILEQDEGHHRLWLSLVGIASLDSSAHHDSSRIQEVSEGLRRIGFQIDPPPAQPKSPSHQTIERIDVDEPEKLPDPGHAWLEPGGGAFVMNGTPSQLRQAVELDGVSFAMRHPYDIANSWPVASASTRDEPKWHRTAEQLDADRKKTIDILMKSSGSNGQRGTLAADVQARRTNRGSREAGD